jgi:hypothetical protein
MSDLPSSVEIDELVQWIMDADDEHCQFVGGWPSSWLRMSGNLIEAFDAGEGDPCIRVHSSAKLVKWRSEVDRLKAIHSYGGDSEDWSALVRDAEPLDMPWERE